MQLELTFYNLPLQFLPTHTKLAALSQSLACLSIMMAKPIAGSYTEEENELTHKKSDFPKLGISYHTYSLTSLGGRREHPGEGHEGRGRLGQQAVTTQWASMKLEGGSQKPA